MKIIRTAVLALGFSFFAALMVTQSINAGESPCSHHHGEDCCVNGRSDAYKRFCNRTYDNGIAHGWYDIRFGGCPACKAPRFGF